MRRCGVLRCCVIRKLRILLWGRDMVFGEDHDYVKFPELSNVDLEAELLTSPHFQIVMDFEADVVKVVDGDTVTLQMEERSFSFPLRFRSVDAPELSTGAPGEEARSWLKTQVEGRKAQVVIDPKNRVEKWGDR